jgi:hypothetical protein
MGLRREVVVVGARAFGSPFLRYTSASRRTAEEALRGTASRLVGSTSAPGDPATHRVRNIRALAVTDPLDDIHQQLFGFVPDKHGIAYQRLAAMVLAVVGWLDVAYEVHELPEGREAEQTLDVVAHFPDGEDRRLIVECKHVRGTIGKGIMDQLVGVRTQVGASDAAVITTVGFTEGARNVATDENIAMVLLQVYDEARDGGGFVRRIELTINAVSNQPSAIGIEQGSLEGDIKEPVDFTGLDGTTYLQQDDGLPVETVQQVLAAGAPLDVGTYERRAELPPGRWLPLPGGRVEVRAFTWTETVTHTPTVQIIEEPGEPVLVLRQLNRDGNATTGRLIVDAALYAWHVDSENRVVRRSVLIPPSDDL